MTRRALYLQDAHPIRDAMDYTQYAESKGFEAVWQADSRLVREAGVPMAAFAATTDTIKVGSGVIDVWSRNPARLASMFSTLDDLAPGRIICGLGAWWDPLAAKVGIDRARPLKVMREVVDAVRALLNNETVTMDGFFVHLDGVELDYVHQERRPKDVPIYIGATGMQMMELTGEIADGAVLNYLVSPDYNRRAMEHLEIGAAKAGRSVDDLDRPQLVVCSVDHDRQAALDGARLLVTQYLGQQPTHHEGERCPRVAAGAGAQDPHLAGHARAGGRGVEARARRHRPDDLCRRFARRVPREGRRVHGQRLHLADPLSAGRCQTDDRHVRRVGEPRGGGATRFGRASSRRSRRPRAR